MPKKKALVLQLSIPQLDMLQAAQQNHSALDALGGIPLGLKTSVDLAKLEILENLAYSQSPKNTREFITREAILDKIQTLKIIAESKTLNCPADFQRWVTDALRGKVVRDA